MDVVPYEHVPMSTRDSFRESYGFVYTTWERAEQPKRALARQVVREEAASHHLFEDCDRTVAVEVQTQNYRQWPPQKAGPRPACTFQNTDDDVTVIVFDEWILDNVSDEMLRGIVKHELCHAARAADDPSHNEDDEIFQTMCDDVGAVPNGSEMAQREVWDRIPRQRHRA